MTPTAKPKPKTERELKHSLTKLSDAVLIFMDALDEVMKRPESRERGQQIAGISNWLDMENDCIRFGPLGVDFRKDDKRKALLVAKERRRK